MKVNSQEKGISGIWVSMYDLTPCSTLFFHFEVSSGRPEGEEGCAAGHPPRVCAEVIYNSLCSLKLHS